MEDTSTVYLAVRTIAMKRRVQSAATQFAFEAQFMVSLITRMRIDQNGDLLESDETLIGTVLVLRRIVEYSISISKFRSLDRECLQDNTFLNIATAIYRRE